MKNTVEIKSNVKKILSFAFPPIFSYQFNKSATTQVLLFHSLLGFDHPEQILDKGVPHRNDEPSAHRQLIDQRLRNIRRPCRDENGIEWTLLQPSKGPIEDSNFDIEIPQFIKQFPSSNGQRTNSFDGKYFLRQFSQNGCLVS